MSYPTTLFQHNVQAVASQTMARDMWLRSISFCPSCKTDFDTKHTDPGVSPVHCKCEACNTKWTVEA